MANPQKKETLKKSGKAKDFTSTLQPTSEQKKAGRDRKRQAQKIMNEMILYQDMTADEFQEFIKKKDTKLGSIITATYMREIIKDKKIMTHRLDKHIPNAPTQVTGDDGPIEIDIQSASIDDLLRMIKTN